MRDQFEGVATEGHPYNRVILLTWGRLWWELRVTIRIEFL